MLLWSNTLGWSVFLSHYITRLSVSVPLICPCLIDFRQAGSSRYTLVSKPSPSFKYFNLDNNKVFVYNSIPNILMISLSPESYPHL